MKAFFNPPQIDSILYCTPGFDISGILYLSLFYKIMLCSYAKISMGSQLTYILDDYNSYLSLGNQLLIRFLIELNRNLGV